MARAFHFLNRERYSHRDIHSAGDIFESYFRVGVYVVLRGGSVAFAETFVIEDENVVCQFELVDDLF